MRGRLSAWRLFWVTALLISPGIFGCGPRAPPVVNTPDFTGLASLLALTLTSFQ
jgi:hypothetical protein